MNTHPPHDRSSPPSAQPANRLGREVSPYLRQHAHNPVDWWPWSEEAFAEARHRDVPIFLSIGYSTCYWCHVMERESFESVDIARRLNDAFVCIKVDREERPDVDDIYMAAVQAFTGRGGWPMSVFLEPVGLRPFWAGTYLPPADRTGMEIPGLPRVTEALSTAWREQRGEVLEQAEQLAIAARERVEEHFVPVRPSVEHVRRAVVDLLRLHDRRSGGFGPAPKFPQPVFLELLLDVRESADESTRSAIDSACRSTLDAMALGGIHDQIGGGFHRYSVDAHWTVPHFEKMLYDNAQLALTYARAWRVYADPLYRRTADRTLQFVLREMTDSAGAFWAAQDAEVHAREGLSYLWTPQQVRESLAPGDAELAIQVYALAAGPNFRDPHHPGDPPTNVLRWSDRPAVLAERMGMSEASLFARMDGINEQLLAVRNRRDQPSTDDKLIAAWNGMMIHAMAECSELLDDAGYLEAARRSLDSVWQRLVGSDDRLKRTWRDGRPGAAGVLEDYAWLSCAASSLARAEHAAAGDTQKFRDMIGRAASLLKHAEQLFGAAGENGGLFDAPSERQDLFVRPRSAYDGAMPSGVSVMIHAYLDLARAIGDLGAPASNRAIELLISISGAIDRSPTATANSTRALLRCLRDNGDRLDSVSAGLSAPSGVVRAAAEPTLPVEVLASVDRVEVAPDKPAAFELRLVIQPGYHINAAVPVVGHEFSAGTPLIGLRVGVTNGTGILAYADYPKGEPSGTQGELRVHRGTIELKVVVERDEQWSGRPVLTMTYQACTDTECLQPTTVELDIAIDRA